jgi:L-2-hydroxyglutarate oxidase LhgO
LRQPAADVVVVGAGVVGLAAAAALARAGRAVIVLEARDGIAQEITARNSEVVHAGIYYPPGSWKARLCRAGNEALYARCREHRVPHARTGKLIVATDEGEVAVLERLEANAEANGVPGLEILGAGAVARMEPAVRAVAALHSPSTGIVDAHAFALSFLTEAEEHGAQLLLRTPVTALERRSGAWRVEARGPEGRAVWVECAAVVNAAGLASDRIAALAGIDIDARGYRIHPCKGDYFALAPGSPLRVARLVYPVPGSAGLGVHATVDLGGRIRFGPDAEYVESPRYDVDPAKAARFAGAVQRYLPAVRAEWLAPDYAGVRPKLAAPGEGFRDFVVCEESEAGLPGLVDCIGIESPGLTAAPAIGERVVELLAGSGS